MADRALSVYSVDAAQGPGPRDLRRVSEIHTMTGLQISVESAEGSTPPEFCASLVESFTADAPVDIALAGVPGRWRVMSWTRNIDVDFQGTRWTFTLVAQPA